MAEHPQLPDRGIPLLIYDGDCAFCRYCVDYARAATGDAVAYRPYQAVADAFPEIEPQAFRGAIQLVLPDGRIVSGAEAAFRTLELGGHSRLWAAAYRRLPPVAWVSERAYAFVARHRPGTFALCRALWGSQLRPARVDRVCWLFLRLLALIYLVAFASFSWQAAGLVGDEGILPARDFFAAVDLSYGPEKYALLPTLLWLDASTHTILALGIGGCLGSLLVLADRGTRWLLPLLYSGYLSLFHAGQVFMRFQWDILLLECGFLAIFLPWRPLLVTWLYRWLLFRFMLQSGLVKLLSGDPAWAQLTALAYHFETQPLPNPLSWYAHQLPVLLLQAGTALTLFIELVVPFLILLPRRPRAWAATLIAVFQVLITVSGNYNFFNLLTLCLCLLLLDDGYLPRGLAPTGIRWPRRWRRDRVLLYPLLGLYLVVSALHLGVTGHRLTLAGPGRALVYWSAPWHIANGYGVFAVMTTQRPEVVFEGSPDGRRWLAYELPFKPGDPQRTPGWAMPHQPRLDWQLWFAAQTDRDHNPWMRGVIRGLLQNSPPVLALFAHNPFPEKPPRYLRASLYHYRFATPEERTRDGIWWQREYRGRYWPVTGWQIPVKFAARH
jgi:predicted DCC family thiol-disulfide oxidoreductase YuxK